MKLVPFEAAHAVVYPEMQALLRASLRQYMTLLNAALSGPAYTLVDRDGSIVGSAGIVVIRPGLGEAWMMVTPLARRKVVAGFRYLRDTLDRLQADLRLTRVQAIVMDTPSARRLAALLGFEIEGLLRAYGWNGEDCYMASRILR